MKFGFIFPQIEIGPNIDDVARYAELVEASGFDFLALFDHVLGAERANRRPGWRGQYDIDDQFHEVFVVMGFLAARTSIELATEVLVLPQRQTVLVAKQAAQIDLLTNGRFRLGVGIGWNDVEFEALGSNYVDRARRYEEQIEVLRTLWTERCVDYTGEQHRIDRAGLLPRPVQQPIPVWLGGFPVDKVVERVGRMGDGWMCNVPPDDTVRRAVDLMREAAVTAGRAPSAIGLEGRVTVGEQLDESRVRSEIEAWEAMGATHVAFNGMRAGRTVADHFELVSRMGSLL